MREGGFGGFICGIYASDYVLYRDVKFVLMICDFDETLCRLKISSIVHLLRYL